MGEFIPRFEQRDADSRTIGPARLPTAGAIPVKNEKGQIVMQKVKVQRYVAGQAPAFAKEPSESESDSEDDRRSPDGRDRRRGDRDRRDRGDRRRHEDSRRHRRVEEPQILGKRTKDDGENDDEGGQGEDSDDELQKNEERRLRARMRRLETERETTELDEEGEEDDEEDEFERRRRLIKQKAREREELEARIKQEVKEEAEGSGASDEEEEESEEDESDDDFRLPKLKPVFVRKKDRVTLMEKEKEEQRKEEERLEMEKFKEERKKESVKLLEEINRREEEEAKRKKEDTLDLNSVPTDDESEELAYEQWKIREMKRIKRDRDEKEKYMKEKEEIDRIHNMTEDERKAYLRANPKIVTNKAMKGKFKFLQKYYHRGAFFLDEEDDVYKRNFAEATLEDKFDKTILPKVMQVKNFGKASRSKWTHLTAEDTTDHQGTWATTNALNVNFFNKHAGGARETFERPASKKRKT